jgi:hypothetical protein
MSLVGPDEAKLAPLPRAVLTALSERLTTLAPPLLDGSMTKATRRDDGVELVLAHARDPSCSVWVQAARDGVVVGCAALHAEFGDAAGAVEAVTRLLCGEREVRGYDGRVLRPDFGATRR